MPLLQVDVARLAVESAERVEALLFLLLREARLQQAMLFLTEIDLLVRPEHLLLRTGLWKALNAYEGELIMSGSEAGVPVEQLPEGLTRILFTYPDLPARKARWRKEAELRQIRLAEEDLDALASRFRLTFTQIAHALAMACNERNWRIAQRVERCGTQPDRRDLFHAARAQAGHELAALAPKVEAHLTWDDLVLPQDQLAQLRDLCDQARYSHLVYDQWGFGRKLPARDLNALFSGPPGTGKTMAAGIIAAELGLDLYKIDLSQVVSKYIGETEKNLHRIFQAAEHSNAVLFFDEADTLFGKRTQVKDAHDRYANVEVGYLLQQMEEYDGVALLASNLPANIDEAFLRRLKFSIEFPFPDEPDRLLIWQNFFPPAVPVSTDIDFPFLARQFKLAGGNIKNIALSAAFLAAARDEPLSMRHIILAAHREYQKMGKMSLEAEFGQYYRLVKLV
jgi:SpoVK/Ycf46/Vps4 family AAA+-type ATPase